MLLTVALPAGLALEGEARVRLVHATADASVAPGAKLLDFSVDRSAGVAHDCPPIAHYRLILRERGVLRTLLAAPGDAIVAGAPVALLATDLDDPPDGVPARAARVTVAGIVFHAEGWGAHR